MTTTNKTTDELHAIYADISQRREQAAIARDEAKANWKRRNASYCNARSPRGSGGDFHLAFAVDTLNRKEEELFYLVEAEKKAFAEFSDRLAEFSRHRVYSVD